MRPSYNPFSKPAGIATEHGYINYRHDMGTTYVTHRRPEHFFKKYQGFAISKTELETCYQEHVYWVLIVYQNAAGGQQPYRIKLSDLQYCQTYDNEGDEQVIIPIKHMQKRREEGWE